MLIYRVKRCSHLASCQSDENELFLRCDSDSTKIGLNLYESQFTAFLHSLNNLPSLANQSAEKSRDLFGSFQSDSPGVDWKSFWADEEGCINIRKLACNILNDSFENLTLWHRCHVLSTPRSRFVAFWYLKGVKWTKKKLAVLNDGGERAILSLMDILNTQEKLVYQNSHSIEWTGEEDIGRRPIVSPNIRVSIWSVRRH